MAPKPKKTTLLTLTEDQRTEIRQAFDLFDSEGQGASTLHCTTPRKRCSRRRMVAHARGRRDRLQRAQSCVARARFRASERGGNDSPPHLVARLAEPSAILPCAGEADDREHRQDGQRQDRLQRVPGAAPRQNGARCHTESLSPPLALPPRLPLPHRLQHLTSRMA